MKQRFWGKKWNQAESRVTVSSCGHNMQECRKLLSRAIKITHPQVLCMVSGPDHGGSQSFHHHYLYNRLKAVGVVKKLELNPPQRRFKTKKDCTSGLLRKTATVQ